MTIAKEAIRTPFITRAMYWTMAKMSPALGAPSISIRAPPTQTMTTAAALKINRARGATAPIWTLARMMFSAITLVASARRSCSWGSLLKARITRMPHSRSRMMSFCRSM